MMMVFFPAFYCVCMYFQFLIVIERKNNQINFLPHTLSSFIACSLAADHNRMLCGVQKIRCKHETDTKKNEKTQSEKKKERGRKMGEKKRGGVEEIEASGK